MASGPSIVATLGLDTKPMQAGLDSAKSKLSGFAGGFAKFGGVAAGIGILAKIGKELIDFGDTLNDQASQLDLTTTKWQELVGAFDDTKPENLAKAMTKLNQSIADAREGNEKTTATFKALGVTWANLFEMSPDEILLKISDAAKNSSDPVKTLAGIMDVLGKSGASMVPNLKLGSDEIKRMGEEAEIASEASLAAADKISRGFTTMFNNLKAKGLNLFTSGPVQEFFKGTSFSMTPAAKPGRNRAEMDAETMPGAKPTADVPISPEQIKAQKTLADQDKQRADAALEDAKRLGAIELKRQENQRKANEIDREFWQAKLAAEKEASNEIRKQRMEASVRIRDAKMAALQGAENEFLADPSVRGEHQKQRDEAKKDRLRKKFDRLRDHEIAEDERRARTGAVRHGRPGLLDRAQKNFEQERAKILEDMQTRVDEIAATLKGKFTNE